MTGLDTALQAYRELLEGGHFEPTASALTRAVDERRLTWLGAPLCSVLRPYFIPAAMLPAANRAASLVVRGLGAAAAALAREPALRAQIGLTRLEEAAVRADRGEATELVGRIDGFLGPDQRLRFIEYNPDPGAVANYFTLARLFARLPVTRAFSRHWRVRNTCTLPPLAGLLLRVAARVAARGGVTVVQPAPDTPDALTRQLDQEIGVSRAVLRRFGLRLEVVTPHALDFHGGTVLHAGRRVACVYVTDWEALYRHFPGGHPFWSALETGRLWALNSWASKVLRANKATFALLSDAAHAGLFEPEVAEALRAHVPWTRLLRDGPAQYGDRQVDLLPFAEARREELVLKPSAAQGGKGVVLGWLCDAAEWQAALQSALAAPHVLQERVRGLHEPFPCVLDGRLAWHDYAIDIDAFVWGGGRVHGYMARVSRGALMNVTAGSGSLAPVFSIDLE